MEIAKKFRPVLLPSPGARAWHRRGGKKLLYLRRSPSPSVPLRARKAVASFHFAGTTVAGG
jgi:hypothetical protein